MSAADHFPRRFHADAEPQIVIDRENDFFLSGFRDQGIALFRGIGHRFFQNDIFPGLQQTHGDFIMSIHRFGRRQDHIGFRIPEQFVQRAEYPVFPVGGGRRIFRKNIVETADLETVRTFFQFRDMEGADPFARTAKTYPALFHF